MCKSSFLMTGSQKQSKRVWPITTSVNYRMNQSELEAKSCSRWKARENGRQSITVDVGLIEIDSENKTQKTTRKQRSWFANHKNPYKYWMFHFICIIPARVLLCINGSFSEVYTLLSPEINKIYLQDNDLGVILVHFWLFWQTRCYFPKINRMSFLFLGKKL